MNGVRHSIKLHDTAGQEEYDKIRRFAYEEAHVFILCYSINNDASFENIKEKWIPELKMIGRKVPIVLVGKRYFYSFQFPNHPKLNSSDKI